MRTRLFIAVLLVSALTAGTASAQPAIRENVKIYAAAVVKTPLTAIAADYEKTTGNTVMLVFDTAGATAQRFRADPQAALLITTVPLIRDAESSGALRDGTTTVLGSTVAGVAVPPKSPKPDVSSPEKLKAALLAAKRIAVSDPARGATVGTHFMKVIEALGVKIGFVFQQFNLLARTPALENVELPLLYSREGVDPSHQRGLNALRVVGLADRADHRPNQLSGGQQQRVAIARSLINNPQIILADEPTGALDSRTSIEIMAIFQRLNREQGISIIVVTHEPDISQYADRIIYFKDGRIVRDEPVRQRRDAERELLAEAIAS